MATHVTVYEVGPRDGLQNEARVVPTDDKLRLIRLLADAGLSRIEATSFVSPKWIPPLADAHDVVRGLPRRPELRYVVLVPNARGLDRLFGTLYGAGYGMPSLDVAVFRARPRRTTRRTSTGRSTRPWPRSRRSSGRRAGRGCASGATSRRRSAARTRAASSRRASRRSPSGSSR